MGRWEEGARERLVIAALDLFTEQGYDDTTVAQIAERAGVTRSTFFRYFPDKRDVLTAGQETFSLLLAEGIADAPTGATPLDAVAAGLERMSTAMGPISRELSPQLRAVISASTELQQRQAAKSVGLAVAISDALVSRGILESTALVAGQLGMLAFHRGYEQWSEGEVATSEEFARLTLAALAELRAASAALG